MRKHVWEKHCWLRTFLLCANGTHCCQKCGWGGAERVIPSRGKLISLFSSVLLSDCLSENNGLVRKHTKFSSDFSPLFSFFSFLLLSNFPVDFPTRANIGVFSHCWRERRFLQEKTPPPERRLKLASFWWRGLVISLVLHTQKRSCALQSGNG